MQLVHGPGRWARLALAAVGPRQRLAARPRGHRRAAVHGSGNARLRATASVGAVVLAAVLAACGGSGPSPSATSLPAPSYQPLASDTSFGPGEGDKVLVETSLSLQAGEKRRVVGRLEVTSSRTPGGWLPAAVWCLDSTGHQSGATAWTGTNHQGARGPYTPPGHLVMYPSLLFTAPSAGTYTCQLVAETDDPDKDYRITAVKAGSDPALGGTWLQVSSSNEPGARWWQNPDCNSTGTLETCSYVDGSTELRIFDNDGTLFEPWSAADNATTASVSATVELTTCDHGTSCPANHRGDSGGSKVSTHLEFDQYRPGVGSCQENRTPEMTYLISNAAHHDSIHYQLDNVPISATCWGTRFFALIIFMKRVSGNPVKIDGTSIIEGLVEGWTDPYAFNSAFETPVPVPDVRGSSESAARQAIAAAGLAVGDVSRAVNSAPVGTVISQNSPGGTVEPVHSPVDLVVSRGAVTVPNVLSLDKSLAVAAIHAAGLVVGTVSHIDNCVDPGTVQTQHPAGTSVVAPGSAVNLTVSACSGGGPNK
jgi:hypothetical protein